MTIQTLKNQTCCFTGHRPQSLPWRYNEHTAGCCELKDELYLQIEKAIRDGYNHFIVGMALGIDTYVGEMLILFKQIYPAITMEAAIPCQNQGERWTAGAK